VEGRQFFPELLAISRSCQNAPFPGELDANETLASVVVKTIDFLPLFLSIPHRGEVRKPRGTQSAGAGRNSGRGHSMRNTMRNLFICSVLSAVLGGAVAAWLVDEDYQWPVSPPIAAAQGIGSQPDTSLVANASVPLRPSLTSEEQTNIRVYEGANRGVVNITTRTVSYDRFFMIPTPGEGAGSGAVIDNRGHILTNNHVIEDARAIQVTVNGKEYSAELVGSDADSDVAVLKVDAPASELYPVPIGTSDNLQVGQRVYTLGNPFGLQGTLTTGIISSLNRTLEGRAGVELKSLIQTDAAMNPGNSGGPLLDTSGRMIGMNVAIATRVGQSAGVGFAIPINRIRQIVPQLIEHGKVVRADIGIVMVNEIDEGLQIVQLNRGGPAERAGLRGWKLVRRNVRRGPFVTTVEQADRSAADIIVAVDGQFVESASAFVEKIEEHQPGDQIVLTIIREGQQLNVPVTLGST
jgi:S1-C subfamily serine protease